jgi:hypothetical protein
MISMGIQRNVILSGVLFDEGEKNGVDGSLVVWPGGELHEILRLRNSPFGRIAPLRMTFKLLFAV